MNTKNKFFSVVAPLYTKRRLALSILKDLLVGRGLNRLSVINFKNWRKFRDVEFTCNVCSKEGVPFYDFPDIKIRQLHKVGLLRETLACKSCGATVRARALAFGLLAVVNERLGVQLRSVEELAMHGLRGLRILDTDAFSPISGRLAGIDGYVRSSFLPERSFGAEISPSYFNIDLENINFDDASFDIVLSSDVMEHVRFCDQAHLEIYRIIAVNGSYVFNVPNDMSMSKNWILIDPYDNDKVLSYPLHYHGDPLSGGILSYRVFGQELLSNLDEIGFDSKYSLVHESKNLIVGGDLFVARKLFEKN